MGSRRHRGHRCSWHRWLCRRWRRRRRSARQPSSPPRSAGSWRRRRRCGSSTARRPRHLCRRLARHILQRRRCRPPPSLRPRRSSTSSGSSSCSPPPRRSLCSGSSTRWGRLRRSPRSSFSLDTAARSEGRSACRHARAHCSPEFVLFPCRLTSLVFLSVVIPQERGSRTCTSSVMPADAAPDLTANAAFEAPARIASFQVFCVPLPLLILSSDSPFFTPPLPAFARPAGSRRFLPPAGTPAVPCSSASSTRRPKLAATPPVAVMHMSALRRAPAAGLRMRRRHRAPRGGVDCPSGVDCQQRASLAPCNRSSAVTSCWNASIDGNGRRTALLGLMQGWLAPSRAHEGRGLPSRRTTRIVDHCGSSKAVRRLACQPSHTRAGATSALPRSRNLQAYRAACSSSGSDFKADSTSCGRRPHLPGR